MATNQYINRVDIQRGNSTETLINISDTTAVASDVAQGKYFYLASGEKVEGASTGGTMVIRDTQDSHGGTVREITAGDVVSGTKTITANGSYDVAQYADAEVNVPSVTPTLQVKTATPTTTQQTITPDSGYDGLSSVTVSAMPTGTAGTPTATKGTVSSHAISVTPSVTNSTGYISGGTKTGTTVTVSASELVSGTLSITENGTVDVTNLASVDVAVESSGGASNLVHGTFTTGSTRATVESTTLAYTGTGYPVAAVVFVKGGIYNSTSAGDSTWYNSVNRYDVGAWYMTKSEATTAPIYDTAQTYTQGAAAIMYKNSTSDPTTYTQSAVKNQQIYTSSNVNPADGTKCVTFKGSGTNLAWYVGNLASNARGLAPDTEYEYYVIYSS